MSKLLQVQMLLLATATILFALSTFASAAIFNVYDYGLVPNDVSIDTSRNNGEVFYNVAMNIANTDSSQRNYSDNDGYNTVYLPSDPSNMISYIPFKPFVGLYKIHFQISGRIILDSSNVSRANWPTNGIPRPSMPHKETVMGSDSVAFLSSASHLHIINPRQKAVSDNQTEPLDAFFIFNSTGIRFDGGGVIDGQGYPWWWDTILTGQDERPYLLVITQTDDIYLGQLEYRDSPMYHIALHDVKTILVEYVKVAVNIEGQKEIQAIGKDMTRNALMAAGKGPHRHHLLSGSLFGDGIPLLKDIPTFPLNTDGIDIAGVDVVVRHCNVENFDDALCVKPLTQKSVHGPCSRNQYWYNNSIQWGVGASIGSVGPDPDVNCISDIIFENIHFTNALKTMYIKPNPCPNPATDGTGIINNITYKDIVTVDPVTWPIWFSTQQQHQPGHGTNTGCSFLFPLPGQPCPTQPCVPITNVYLKNVTSTGGGLSAGVVRCNEANPCRNITFEDVNINGAGFPFGSDSYLCQAIDNFSFIGNSFPSKCIYNWTEGL